MDIHTHSQDRRVLVLDADDWLNEFASEPPVEEVELGASQATEVLVVDCSAMQKLTSSGIGNLLKLRDHGAGLGLEFCLAGLSEMQAGVLKASKLGGVFETYASVEDAANSV